MTLSAKTRSVLSFFLRFGLSGLLLFYLFSKIDMAEMKTTVQSADFRFLCLAGLIYFCLHIFLLTRWFVFIKALDLQVSFASIISCFYIGLFFNLFLPTSTGGDIFRTWFLFRDTSEKAKVAASVVADRLWGFISIVCVATVAFIFGYRFLNDRTLLLMIGVLATLSFCCTFVLFNEKLYAFCCRVFSWLPKVKDKLMRFHYAIALIKNKPYAIFAPIGLSVLSQSFLVISFYCTSKALHQDVDLIYFFIFVPMICVISSLPSIGGLGARDLGAAYLFGKVGMAAGVAVSLTLISFFFMTIVGLIGGVFYVIALSPGRVQRYQTDTDIGPEEA